MKTALSRWLLPVVAGVVGIAVWYALRHVVRIPAWLLPVPHEILAALDNERELLARAAWRTTQSAILGFAAAALAGLCLAVVLGSSRMTRRALYPYLLFLQMTPVIVIAPLVILWVGRGTPSIVIVTFIVSFFPVVVNTTLGITSTDRNMMELFTVWDATRWQRLVRLQLPFAAPFYFAGLRIAATLAPIGAIFGEYVTGSFGGGEGGLGFLTAVFNARQMRPELFAVGLASCTLGFVFLGVISLVNWLLLRRWHDSLGRADS
ncbi:MAG TPA: ABC transporter permease subunit [Opitutaceae bacterium]|nr:ABC transporter permease subunit [Opitutaceae bacterium]